MISKTVNEISSIVIPMVNKLVIQLQKEGYDLSTEHIGLNIRVNKRDFSIGNNNLTIRTQSKDVSTLAKQLVEYVGSDFEISVFRHCDDSIEIYNILEHWRFEGPYEGGEIDGKLDVAN